MTGKNSGMKITHIVSTYPPYFGGMGNVVFQMAQHLGDRGHEVQVLTPDYFGRKEIRPKQEQPLVEHSFEVQERIDVAKRIAPKLQYGNAAYIPNISDELMDSDIVHLHYPFFGTANVVRRWKQRHPDKALVITYHMDTRGPGWKGLVFKYYAHRVMPKVLDAADMIIGSSFDYIQESDVGDFYKKNKAKWRELPFGVDTNRFFPDDKPQELFERYGLDHTQPTLIFVGGMDPAHYFKGVPVLLRALSMVKDRSKPVQAVLVGGGSLRQKYITMTKQLGIEETTVFVGKVSDDDLPIYYRMGDLCVLPSTTVGEAFGMVLLEAMSSGVPVLASDLPGVRTVAKDGGILAQVGSHEDFAEAIMGYYTKENDIQAWKEKARTIADEKYAWDPIVARLEKIYEELVEGV